jgi:hypothetical protein
MTQTDGAHVASTLVEMASVLEPAVGGDWSVRAGPLAWTCSETGVHVAQGLLKYACQLVVHATDSYLPFELKLRSDSSPLEVLTLIRACGRLLADALRSADADLRAWHYGMADSTGFEAMAVGEILLHTYDITRGLGLAWDPPEQLCTLVLRRLFPDAPPGDPASVLLWATGRGDLEGHQPVTEWVWRSAVL